MVVHHREMVVHHPGRERQGGMRVIATRPIRGQLDAQRRKWYYITKNVMGQRWWANMESAITSKGQATIPRAIREHLRLKPGDRVKFFVHPDGSVVILPKLPVSALRGIVKSRRRPVPIEAMTAAAAAGAADVAPRRRSR
jgi:antitoxin PrlF